MERRYSVSSPCVSLNVLVVQLINSWDHMKAAIAVLVSVSLRVMLMLNAQTRVALSRSAACVETTVRTRPLTHPFYHQLHEERIKYSLLPSELRFCQHVLPSCTWPGGRDGSWHSRGVVWLPGGAPEQCKGSFPALPSEAGIILPVLHSVTTRG